MSKKILHPGITLNILLEERKLSQRDLADRIDVAYSLLNNVLKGNRNINTSLAIAFESAGLKEANYWLIEQMKYNLDLANNSKEVIEKKKSIEEWKELESLVPLAYLKKQELGVNSSEDISKVYEMYQVSNISGLKELIQTYNPVYFRKSSKFKQNKENILAWSLLAEYKLKQEIVGVFDRDLESNLINELNQCFYENKRVIDNSSKILAKYGIKFIILDRPPQTPVDGKSFMLEGVPAIALTLKYKRLDNFAFTLMHEIAHVFEHLTNPQKPEYREAEFFINTSKMDLVEFEADSYSSDKLINQAIFDDFVASNDDYSDEAILHFAKLNKVHPGIVRGRICFEFPEYYRKRSSVTNMNRLKLK